MYTLKFTSWRATALATLPVLAIIGCNRRSTGGAAGAPAVAKPLVSLQNIAVTEGNAGNAPATFTIALDKAATGPVTFRARTTAQTAKAGEDFAAIDNQLVTINAGDTTVQVTINVIGDTTVEPNETFRLTLSNLTGGAKFGNTSAVCTINNDDVNNPPPPAGSGRIVYTADPTTAQEMEVFVTDFAGSFHTRLSPPKVAGQEVKGSITLSPNREYVAMAVEGAATPTELYIAKVDGSTLVKVSDAATAGGQVSIFDGDQKYLWSPDSTRVYYRQNVSGETNLYVVNVDGTNRVKVNGALGASEDVEDGVRWSPNGQFLSYTVRTSNFSYAHRIGRADGSGEVTVSNNSKDQRGSGTWAPDGSRIVLITDEPSDGDWEVRTVTPDGLTNTIIGPQQPGNETITRVEWAPNGSRIAMIVQDPVPNGARNLWTDLPTGGDAKKVSAALNLPILRDVNVFGWKPDSTRLVYEAEFLANNIFSVFSANPDGTDNKDVGAPNLSGGSVFLGFDEEVIWARDGNHFVYPGTLNSSIRTDLYSSDTVTLNGGKKITPNFSNSNGGPAFVSDIIKESWFSPDLQQMLFRLDATTDNLFGLYAAKLDGTATTLINDTGTASGLEPRTAVFSKDGSKLIVSGDLNQKFVDELFIMNADGSGRVKLSQPIPPQFAAGVGDIFVIE